MTTYHPGLLVTHPNKPEWGPGKVVHVDGRSVHVIWRDLPERVAKCINVGHVPLPAAAEQSDEVLDNLPPLKGGKDGKWSLPRERVAFDAAVSSFLRRFPQGFAPAPTSHKERADRPRMSSPCPLVADPPNRHDS